MKLCTFRRLAWTTLIYLVFVIVWGAFVRASGSGAGCGDHWPLCNGQLIPRDPSVETIVEISHRITSGLALILVFALFVFSKRLPMDSQPIRSASRWSLIFIIIEALIGAGLVLFELVAHDASLKRAVSMSAHLLNTFALLSALVLVIFRTSSPKAEWLLSWKDIGRFRDQSIVFALLILTGMTGAIAALGDTLYSHLGAVPLKGYFVEGYPILMRLRLIHPVVALITVVALMWTQVKLLLKVADNRRLSMLGWLVSGLALIEVVLGLVNVYLMAPIWLQLVHLGTAVFLWIAFSFQCFVFKDNNLKY